MGALAWNASSYDAETFLEQISRGAEESVVRAFLQAVDTAQRGIDQTRLRAALKVTDFNAMIRAVNWESVARTELTPQMARSLRNVFETVADSVQFPGNYKVGWDIVNGHALDWIANETATLVTRVNAQTKQAIRDIVSIGFVDGKSVQAMAGEISQVVGLNAKGAKALANYRKGLEADGLGGDILERRVQVYKNKLVNQRALLIARTETIKAANEGWRSQIKQAAQDRAINPDVWEITWVVARDEKLCEACGSMSGLRRPISGVYAEGEYASMTGPPGHPNCRCFERTIRKQNVAQAKTQEQLDAEEAQGRQEQTPPQVTKRTGKPLTTDQIVNAMTKRIQAAHPDWSMIEIQAETRRAEAGMGEFSDFRSSLVTTVDLRQAMRGVKTLPFMPPRKPIDQMDFYERRLYLSDKNRAIFGKQMSVTDEGYGSVQQSLANLSKLPDEALYLLKRKGAEYYVGAQQLPKLDAWANLAGQHPRGWDPGDTWEMVGGVCDGLKVGVSEAVSHGSVNTILHETGHVLDNVFNFSATPGLKAARLSYEKLCAMTGRTPNPYYMQAGSAGYEEFLAETFAATFENRADAVATFGGDAVRFIEGRVTVKWRARATVSSLPGAGGGPAL